MLWLSLAMLVLISGCASTPSQDKAHLEKISNSIAIQEHGTNDALNESKEKLASVPRQAQTLFAEALAQMKQGDVKTAESSFKQLTTEYPDLSGPFLNLAIIYLADKQVEQAKNMLNRALSVNPSSQEAHNLLGVIAREQGQFQAASTHYLAAIQINQAYAPAHLNLGILYDLYMGQLDKALTEYKIYDNLTAKKDKTVKRWIRDTERRLKKQAN